MAARLWAMSRGATRVSTGASFKAMQKASASFSAPACMILYAFRSKLCSALTMKIAGFPAYADMKEMAWQIRSKSAGHEAGFVTVEALKNSQEQEE